MDANIGMCILMFKNAKYWLKLWMYMLEFLSFMCVYDMYPHVWPSYVFVFSCDVYVSSIRYDVCNKDGLVDKLGLCVRVLEVYVDTADVCEEMGGSCFTFLTFPPLFTSLLFSSLLFSSLPFPSLLFSSLLFSSLFYSTLLFSYLLLSARLVSALIFSCTLFSSLRLSSLRFYFLLFSSLLFSFLFITLVSWFIFASVASLMFPNRSPYP